MVQAGDIITDADKLIDRQMEQAAISTIAGFAKIFKDAVKGGDLWRIIHKPSYGTRHRWYPGLRILRGWPKKKHRHRKRFARRLWRGCAAVCVLFRTRTGPRQHRRLSIPPRRRSRFINITLAEESTGREDVSLGDVKITQKTGASSSACRLWDQALQRAAPLLRDDRFYFEQVGKEKARDPKRID